MKRVLLVDDDPLVLRLYRDGLSHHGFEVATAGDGLAAIGALRASRPDVLVLDLMMPKLSGVEVLKYICGEARLADLPVVIFSNAYMDDLARNAVAVGARVQKVLLKVQSNPAQLSQALEEVLEGKSADRDAPQLLAVPPSGSSAAPSALPQAPPAAPAPPSAPVATPAPARAVERPPAAEQLWTKARTELLAHSSSIAVELRNLFQAFITARASGHGEQQLEAFYRKVHFVTATAGLAQCHRAAQMASVFEALLFVLMEKPARISHSVLRTIANTVDFLEVLLQHGREPEADGPMSADVLVVDDDAMSNRLVVSALRQAQLQARSTEDPNAGWKYLQEQRFDLVLLDVQMPGLNGFELCKRMRGLPGYDQTPVIYVTGHSDFEHRAKGLLSGGQDLIGKPVLPMELAAKVVMHLLKRQMPTE